MGLSHCCHCRDPNLLCVSVQLSRQLRAVRDGHQVTPVEHLAELAFQESAEPKYVKSGRSRSARPPSKPKAGGAACCASG